MIKKLHPRTKIFFPNPHVVRVQLEVLGINEDDKYRKICRRAYKEIKGTWGHTKLEYEHIVLNGIAHSSPELIFSRTYLDDVSVVRRGYFVFKDEMDALQFRLSIDTSSLIVKIWPERWFTIHELEETI